MDGFKLLEHVGLELDLPVISKHTALARHNMHCASCARTYLHQFRALHHPMATLKIKLCKGYASGLQMGGAWPLMPLLPYKLVYDASAACTTWYKLQRILSEGL